MNLKAKAKTLEPVIRIGKNGITENVLEHIKLMLKKRKLIKIKMLKAFVDANNKKMVAKKLAEDTNAELIEQVGFVIVLHKR